MTVPYSKLDDWEMNATLFQGTIYIEENHEKKLSSRQDQYTAGAAAGNMSQDLMSFWGYKFEAVSLLSESWSSTSREYIETREEQIVSNYAQYCSIVRTGFGKTKLILAGEVDAVEAFKPADKSTPIQWVELKTTAEVLNERDQIRFERKLLKFWAQSFLLGVPKIVVGYRSQQGMLLRLQELDVQSIPDKVQLQGKRLWDGQTCINFTSSFLECELSSACCGFADSIDSLEADHHHRRCMAHPETAQSSSPSDFQGGRYWLWRHPVATIR